MGLYPFRKMLELAIGSGFAIGYFEAWDEHSIEAIIEAGEEEKSPIIVGFGGMMLSKDWLERWGIELFASIGRVYAHRCRVPVSLIFNEAQDYNQCIKALEFGFNVIMLNSSSLSIDENIRVTRKLVEKAKGFSAGVEAELGELPMAYPWTDGTLTDPLEAERFVMETGIDALSVSIGNVHVLKRGKPSINIDLLKQIRSRVDIPLVIHGGSGFPPEMVREVISLGVAKFNVGTVLKKVYLNGIRDYLDTSDSDDYQNIVGSHTESDFLVRARENLKNKVKELIQLYGSSNKAHLF